MFSNNRTSNRQPPLTFLRSAPYDTIQRALLRSHVPETTWYAETSLPLKFAQSVDAWKWDKPPRIIDDRHIFPAYNAATMTIADCGNWINPYYKRMDLVPIRMDMFDDPSLCEITAREIQTCEMLRIRMFVCIAA